MLYYPEGNNSHKYIPTSPHYRMLHFLGADDDYIKALIESLLEKDAQGEDYIVQEPPVKKRKQQQAAHIVQRTMIGEKEPRAHLHYFCNKFLGKLKQKHFLTQQQEEVCKRELLAAINTKADICNFVTMFLDKQVPAEMLKEMTKLLHISHVEW